MRRPACRGHQSSSVVISSHQWSSVVISCQDATTRLQRSSVVISDHQWSSVIISGHQSSSVVISGHPWSSASPADAVARCPHASPWRPVAPAAPPPPPWPLPAAARTCHQQAIKSHIKEDCTQGFHRLCLESSLYRDSMADACRLASATSWDASACAPSRAVLSATSSACCCSSSACSLALCWALSRSRAQNEKASAVAGARSRLPT